MMPLYDISVVNVLRVIIMLITMHANILKLNLMQLYFSSLAFTPKMESRHGIICHDKNQISLACSIGLRGK